MCLDMLTTVLPLYSGCMAWWCPCIIYGKTQVRRETPQKQDPGCCNGSVHINLSVHLILESKFQLTPHAVYELVPPLLLRLPGHPPMRFARQPAGQVQHRRELLRRLPRLQLLHVLRTGAGSQRGRRSRTAGAGAGTRAPAATGPADDVCPATAGCHASATATATDLSPAAAGVSVQASEVRG